MGYQETSQRKRQYRQGSDRNQGQLLPASVEDYVSPDNPARVIDAFVDSLDIIKAGFTKSKPRKEGPKGSPAFDPSDMLKLYLYGYMNRIRTTRKLENECRRNLELIWLLNGLQPKYRAIAYFRAENKKAIRLAFRQFVVMMKSWDLIAGDTIAVDGTKLRAVNSKKNNYNQKKIDRHLKYIDDKIEEYLKQLEEEDKKENKEKKIKVKQCLDELEVRKQKYHELEKQLVETGEDQISTTDPEARQLIIRGQITEVAYNAQASVDDKHNLCIDYKALNTNDRKILSTMAARAKVTLKEETFDFLGDKGYHNGEELHKCKDMNITTYVAPSERKHNKPIPTPEYYGEHFIYHAKNDTYTCPQGQTMTTNGSWYKKINRKSISYVRHFKTKSCRQCPVRHLCTTSPKERGRVIERSQYQQAVDENNKRVNTEKEKYRRRQEIVEHPFGVIKRQWGYDHVLVKGLGKVEAELGLIFTVYNLRRLITILGAKELIARLLPFFSKIRPILRRSNRLEILHNSFLTKKLSLSHLLILLKFGFYPNQ
jgi:transposase